VFVLLYKITRIPIFLWKLTFSRPTSQNCTDGKKNIKRKLSFQVLHILEVREIFTFGEKTHLTLYTGGGVQVSLCPLKNLFLFNFTVCQTFLPSCYTVSSIAQKHCWSHKHYVMVTVANPTS